MKNISKGFYQGDDSFTESLAYSSINISKHLSIACNSYRFVAKPANDILSQDTSTMLLNANRWIQSRSGRRLQMVLDSLVAML